MELNYKEFGQGKPLIILHGLFGSLDNWQTMAKKLGESGFHVFTLDARNHGQSPWSDEMNYQVMADDVKDFMDQKALSKAIVLGHSMGGKTAMQFAMDHPEKVEKLIVADIAPKVYPPHHNEILDAMHSVDFDFVDNRQDAGDMLKKYIPEQAVVQFLLKNIYWESKERLNWRFNLKVIDEKYESISSNIPDGEFAGPVLFINGGRSSYIKPAEDSELIKEYFPSAEIKTISGAGHWLHAEAPEEFFNLVKSFAGS